jgi:hypothetical protein
MPKDCKAIKFWNYSDSVIPTSPPLFWLDQIRIYNICAFTFWVLCCDVRYDFHIKTMFGASLPPVVYRRLMSYLRCCWFFLRIVVSNTYRVVCLFCFSSSCVPYAAIFSGLSIFLLPLRYSLTFIYKPNNITLVLFMHAHIISASRIKPMQIIMVYWYSRHHNY